MRYYRFLLILLAVFWGATGFGWGTVQARAQEAPAAQSTSASHASDSTGHGQDVHQADDAHGSEPNPLVVDPDLAIWTVVVFGLLLFVLNKFAWPAISTALDEREHSIEANIASAAEMHEEAKKLLAQHEAKLAEASHEVRELLEEARRDAEHTKSQILAEAKQAADNERERAIREVDRATESAMQRLAETSANLAVDLASKVVRTNVTAEQQAGLVREALEKLAQSSPSEN